MNAKTDNITCPICNKPGTWTPVNKNKPFCSDRCKLIDLGEWASDSRSLPGSPANLDSSNIPDNDED